MESSTKNALIAAIAAVIVAIIGFIGIWYAQENKIAAGNIIVPQQFATVGSQFTATGTLENIPKDNHIWVAIKINDDIWPKKEVNSNNQAWAETIEEYGDTESFNLVIFMVSRWAKPGVSCGVKVPVG